jgi:hypothetical protein
MSSFNSLPKADLDALSKKLGVYISRSKLIPSDTFATEAPPTLTESIEVWHLSPLPDLPSLDSLVSLAKNSGGYYLQIKRESTPIAYAWTSPVGPNNTHDVDGIVQSLLPMTIDKAITWIDTWYPEIDVTVRLLVVPSYQIHAFWLLGVNGSAIEVVIILEAPKSYQLQGIPRVYHPREFLEKLSAYGSIKGIY